MRIDQNTSFKGRITSAAPINSKNPMLRYSLNRLKHHCGGINVQHKVDYVEGENFLMVFPRFFPNDNKYGTYSFSSIKRIDLVSKEKIAEQVREINLWLKKIKSSLH